MAANKPQLYLASSDVCTSPVNAALRCNDLVPGLFTGCYLVYSWPVIESNPYGYDWTNVLAELDLCEAFGLKAVLTLRDKRWVWNLNDTRTHAVPADLLPSGEFEKIQQFNGVPMHRVRMAKRWDLGVQSRYISFIQEAGRILSGHPALVGFEIPETSLVYQSAAELIGYGYPGAAFYTEIMKSYMFAARQAFPNQEVVLALNWIPGAISGEFGEHARIFEYGSQIGVGISVTDIAPQNYPAYVESVYARFAAHKGVIPLGGKMERSSYRLWEAGRGYLGVDWVFDYIDNTLKLDYLVLQDDPVDGVTNIGFYESVLPYLPYWMAN